MLSPSFVVLMERVAVSLALLISSAAFAPAANVASADGSFVGSGQGRELHVLLITSSSQRFNSSGAETAVRLALDRVNADIYVLPGTELQLARVRNSKVIAKNICYVDYRKN